MSTLRVVGNVTWDRLIEVPDFPERNRDYLTLSDATHAGGAGGNLAAGLELLGVPTAMVAAVGSDRPGEELTADLESYGVDTSLIQRIDRPTSEFLCVIDPHGNRSFLLDPGQAAFSLDHVEALSDSDGGYAFAGCRLDLAARILGHCQATRSRLFANIGFWAASGELTADRAELLDRLSCLFLNDDEFDELPNQIRDRLTSSEFLDEERRVIITGGAAEAVVLASSGSTALAPAPHPDVVNTLGCGDSFMAGFLAAHMAGLDVQRCLAIAHECAGRVAASPQERFPDQFDGIVVA